MTRTARIVIGALSIGLVVAIGVIGYLSYALFESQDERRSESEVREAARAFASELTTYSFESVEKDIDQVLDMSTPRFKKEYREVLAGQTFSKTLADSKGVSVGKVEAVYVTILQVRRAEVFVVLEQRQQNASSEPRVETRRLQITMLETDGRWKVDRVSVIT